MKVYCAGPLFCPGERYEMDQLASALEAAGYSTFLPQRDGFEGAALLPKLVDMGYEPDRAQRLLDRVIFCLDIFQLLEACDVTVANLNGRVTDEGTIVEASMTAMAGKPLVLWKEDSRAPFALGDNPMLTGLSDFVVHENHDAVLDAVKECTPATEIRIPDRFRNSISLGEKLAEAHRDGLEAVLDVALKGSAKIEAA